MARRRLIRCAEFPYHVTARSNNQEWFYLPMEKLWEIFIEELQKLVSSDDIIVYQFVLMSNHYHMLLQTPKENIDEVMYRLQKNVSLRVNKFTGRINHVFGGPYKWSLIQDSRYLLNVIKYIFQNPLRARIVSKCENYPYSSLFLKKHSLSGCDMFKLEALVDLGNFKLFLNSINLLYSDDQYEALRKGLRKTQFQIASMYRNNGKSISL